MARSDEVVRARRGVHRHLDRPGAVGGRDASRHAGRRLDGDAEAGGVGAVASGHHERQLELVAALLGKREADEPARLARHERNRRRGDELRGHADVALVLAVGVVTDDDHAPRLKLPERAFERCRHFRNGAHGRRMIAQHSERRANGDAPGGRLRLCHVGAPDLDPARARRARCGLRRGLRRGELSSHHYPRAGTYRGFDQYRSNDGQSYLAVADDAVLAANTEAGLHSALDALSGASPSLADSQRYRHAIAGLPTSRLVTAYADATQVGRLVSLAALGGTGPAFPAAPMARLAQTLHEAGSITASLGADSGGVRLTMNATPDPGRMLPRAFLRRNAPPVLAADVPADAFAYAGGQMGPVPPGFGGPGQAQSMRAFARLTGLSWKRDIAPLLSDTLAAYAAPGLPVTGALLF